MKEQYRVSLKVAKRMKELGYPQDGCDAYWAKGRGLPSWELVSNRDLDYRIDHLDDSGRIEYYVAPCVGRLGDDLPISTNEGNWFQHVKSYNGYNGICEVLSYTRWYEDKGSGQMLLKKDIEISFPVYERHVDENKKMSEADARGMMWCELKERRLV